MDRMSVRIVFLEVVLKAGNFLFVLILSLFLSCSSGDRPVSRHEADRSSPEIGTATMSGGENIKISGYTGDPEVNRQMRLLDLEIIDCYRQNVGRTGIQDIAIDYTFYIDRNGRAADIRYKAQPKDAGVLGECIKRDIMTLGFRPGSPREISSYRLVFRPGIAQKNQSDQRGRVVGQTGNENPRSKMIKDLADMQKFRDCYEEELRKTPGIGGKFTLRFMVSEYGEVENVEITSNTFNEPKVPLCVVKKLVDTRFPRGETDDIVEVNFTFTSSAPLKRRRTMDIDM
jgi:hypothetical protein